MQGSKCDSCKPQFFNLQQSNPDGCTGLSNNECNFSLVFKLNVQSSDRAFAFKERNTTFEVTFQINKKKNDLTQFVLYSSCCILMT